MSFFLESDEGAAAATVLPASANAITAEEYAAIVELKTHFAKNPFKEGDFDYSDFFLAKIVIVAKGDLAKAITRMTNFHNIRQKYKFADLDKEATIAWGAKFHEFMYGADGVTEEGVVVLPSIVRHFTPADFLADWRVAMHWLVLYMDCATSTLEKTRAGCTFVSDMAGMGMKNFSMELEKKGAELYQDAYPIKIKSMLMVNPPFIVNAIVKLMKLFLKKKLADRMKMVYTAEGTKAKRKLDCILDQKFYPACLGGTLDKPVSVWMMESQREMELSISQVSANINGFAGEDSTAAVPPAPPS